MKGYPDTPLVREATQIAEASLAATILAHARRTFLCGRAYGEERSIPFDEEGLCLVALFHDLGLAPRFADPTRAFTEVGADLLLRFLGEHDGDPGRSAALAEAIELHMQIAPRWSRGAEAGLLQVGAWMDVTGLRARSLGREFFREVDEVLPRGSFDREFRRSLVRSLGSFRACYRLVVPARRSRAVSTRAPA